MTLVSSAEIDELDVANGASEEAGTEALEFFDGVGSEEAEACIGGGFWRCPEVERELLYKLVGGGFSGIDDRDACREGAFDHGFEQRIVGAAENERVRLHALGCGVGAEFVEVDAHDFSRNLMAGPALFYEGNEKRAGFLEGAKAVSLARSGVGVAVHGGVGGDNEDVARFRSFVSGFGAGLNDADDWNGGNGLLDVVEGEGAGGVAGDDEVIGALFFNEESRALGGIAGDGAAGLGAVGKSGGVPDEGIDSLGCACDEGTQNSESAEAGIEDADGGSGGRRFGHGVLPCVGNASAVR